LQAQYVASRNIAYELCFFLIDGALYCKLIKHWFSFVVTDVTCVLVTDNMPFESDAYFDRVPLALSPVTIPQQR